MAGLMCGKERERGMRAWNGRQKRGYLNVLNVASSGMRKGFTIAPSLYEQKSRSQNRTHLTLSHAHGPKSPPLLSHTLPQHLSHITALHPQNLALISRSQGKNGRLTYTQLENKSTAIAHGLRRLGVKKGDRVACFLGNGWEFAVVMYGVWKLGGIVVPLNPVFNSLQVISALTHLETAHLIISTETNRPYKAPRENISLLQSILPDLTSPKIKSESVPSLKNIILVDNSSGRVDTSSLKATIPFPTLLENPITEIIPDEPLKPTDIINIQFTSGTTSTPKAACLTHSSILNNGFSIGERMALTPSDIICCPPPLFHCFGSILGYMATVTHGSTILFPSEAFNPLDTLLSIKEEKATGLHGVSTMFLSQLELLQNGSVSLDGFESLRTGIAGGSTVPSSLMGKLHDKLNLKGLAISYGMTETSPVSFMTTLDDPYEKRTDSVGRLMPHVEAKIVSITDRNKTLPIGQRGELIVSGYLVMEKYYNDPLRTSEVRFTEPPTSPSQTPKIWMQTGDEAEMDSQGYVKITGRIKDLIIRGGENIHPAEVENCLLKLDGVRECAVVGLKDKVYGEVVAAFVVLSGGWAGDEGDGSVSSPKKQAQDTSKPKYTLTKNQIQSHIGRSLSHHLVPRYVFWLDEEDLPRTASGKIQKFMLREVGEGLVFVKEEEDVRV